MKFPEPLSVPTLVRVIVPLNAFTVFPPNVPASSKVTVRIVAEVRFVDWN
jgi:hypothetical protein